MSYLASAGAGSVQWRSLQHQDFLLWTTAPCHPLVSVVITGVQKGVHPRSMERGKMRHPRRRASEFTCPSTCRPPGQPSCQYSRPVLRAYTQRLLKRPQHAPPGAEPAFADSSSRCSTGSGRTGADSTSTSDTRQNVRHMRTHSNVSVRLPSALLTTTVDRALALNPMQYRCAWLAASIKPRSSR